MRARRRRGNPGRTFVETIEAPQSSAAPTRSTIDSAISTTSSPLRIQRPARRRPTSGHPPSAHAATPARAACHAGAKPKRMPVRRLAEREREDGAVDRDVVDARDAAGAERPNRWISARWRDRLRAMPPASARTTLSTSICRTRRRRLAPSAVLIAISFSRTDARTSSRLATFAHAMSTTTPTAASRVSSAGRMSLPTICSCSGVTSADSSALESGYCLASRSEIVFISTAGLLDGDAGSSAGRSRRESDRRGLALPG